MNNRKIFYLTICFFGFGLATTLQMANLSSILQFAGYKSNAITYLWLIAPLTGLFSQPVIGLLSDNMRTRFGRRRPLFLISILMGVVGLIFLPFAKKLYALIGLIILLDIGCNGNAQLARALILDLTKGKERTQALSWSSGLYGLGAMFGGILPWCITHLTPLADKTDSHGSPLFINFTFLFGALLYVAFSTVTLVSAKEKILTTFDVFDNGLSQKFLYLGRDLVKSFQKLLFFFWHLSLILFFAWVAVFSIWNYMNVHVAQTLLHMPIAWTDNLEKSRPYLTEANIMTGFFFGILQLSSTFFAFAIPFLNRYYSIQNIFRFGLLLGGFSLLLIALVSGTYQVGFLMFLFGASWSVLTVCPYELFANVIPKNKNGYYMGLLNLPIVFPQIVAGLCLGSVYQYAFSYQAFKVIFLAGVFTIVGGVLVGFFNLKGKLPKEKGKEFNPAFKEVEKASF